MMRLSFFRLKKTPRYLADGSVTLIIVDLNLKAAPGSFLGLLQPAHNILLSILAPDHRQRLAVDLSIQGDVLGSHLYLG